MSFNLIFNSFFFCEFLIFFFPSHRFIMKFGKYLQERKNNFPVEWREHSIDYNSLKLYVKTNISPNTLKLNLSQMTWKPNDPNELHFIQLISTRLSTLQIKTTEFLEK